MLSTTHQPIDASVSGLEMDIKGQTVIRKRKRPKETSSAARTARKPFGNNSTKELRIPRVYNDYNHNMGSVDIADQLRESISGLRRIRKGGWRALWHFLLNLTLVNSFLISGYKTQFDFRNALIRQLLERGSGVEWGEKSGAKSGAKKRKRSQENQAKPNSEQQHQYHELGYRGKKQYCSQCGKPSAKRLVLTEKSTNIQGKKVIRKATKVQGRKQTTYGCIICNIALCKEGSCFESHINS